ncbi:MAG: hypothetical protein ACRD2A_26170, partial [Vicinamibacterales bacterium]
VLFSEPRAGVWSLTRDLGSGEVRATAVIDSITSALATAFIATFVWRRWTDWRARRLDRGDQLVIIFFAVTLANAVFGYAYTKDVIMSPAGAFFAIALTVAARRFLDRISSGSMLRATAAVLLVVVLSSVWAFRAVAAHIGVRQAAEAAHADWAYVDLWLEEEGLVTTDPLAVALKLQLQDDAVRKHPVRPALKGAWVKWFEED